MHLAKRIHTKKKKKMKTHTFPSPVRFSFVFMKTVHSKSRPCTHQPTRMSTKAMFLNRGIQTSRALVKQLRKGTKNAPHHVRFTAWNAGGFCGISYLGLLLKCVGPLRLLLGPKKTSTLREDVSTFTILRCYYLYKRRKRQKRHSLQTFRNLSEHAAD